MKPNLVLSAISHILQAGPASEADPSPDPEKGKQRTTELTISICDVTQPKKPSSTLCVTTDHLRTPGPSRVSWKSPNGNSPGSITRSISTPSLLLSPTSGKTTLDTYRRSSLRRTSSQSLRLDSLHDGESQRDSMSFPPLNLKPLSPITEQAQFPAPRQPSLDTVPPTPSSMRVYDGHSESLTHRALLYLEPDAGHAQSQAQAHPAFITRTLNRSISQASTSSLRSNASGAPTIPPLDLRPNFQATLGIPPGPRKSRLGGSTLPTVLASPTRAPKYSVIYEDGASARTSSFVTAPSEDVAEPDPSTEHEREPHAHEELCAPSGHGSVEDDVPQIALPEGLFDIDLSLDPEPRGRPLSMHPSTTRPSSASRRSTSPSESYIHQRWLKGVSFGSDRFIFPVMQRPRVQTTTACVLFWLGFMGPWCWLIGGWLLSLQGETKSDYGREMVLPMWTKKGKRKSVEKEKMGAKKHGRKSWCPLLAPSVETLTPSSHLKKPSISPWKMTRGTAVVIVDPWVFRCRIAAIISGLCILAAFIVALVVVGRARS